MELCAEAKSRSCNILFVELRDLFSRFRSEKSYFARVSKDNICRRADEDISVCANKFRCGRCGNCAFCCYGTCPRCCVFALRFNYYSYFLIVFVLVFSFYHIANASCLESNGKTALCHSSQGILGIPHASVRFEFRVCRAFSP